MAWAVSRAGVLGVVVPLVVVPLELVVQVTGPAVDLLAVADHHAQIDAIGALQQGAPELKDGGADGTDVVRVVAGEQPHGSREFCGKNSIVAHADGGEKIVAHGSTSGRALSVRERSVASWSGRSRGRPRLGRGCLHTGARSL